MSIIYYSVDTCVFCGEPVPEGRQVCPSCEMSLGSKKEVEKQAKNKARGAKARHRSSVLKKLNAERYKNASRNIQKRTR